MISLIIKSYLTLLLSIGSGALIIFIFGLYLICRKPKVNVKNDTLKKEIPVPAFSSTSDLSAIAGDDVVATQLDLARAYIETNNKSSAKKLLESILSQGNAAQQVEAQHLLTSTHD